MKFSILNVRAWAFSILKVYKSRLGVCNLRVNQRLKAVRDHVASHLPRHFLKSNQGEQLGVPASFFPSGDCLKAATDAARENLATFVQVGAELMYKVCGGIHVDTLAWGSPRRSGR